MGIIRAARPQSNFYILDKQISEDRRLSWSARGLLIFLLGKPDHWQVSVEALLNCGPDKKGNRKEAIYGYLNELIEAGYITRKKHSSGLMDYVVSEIPKDQPDEVRVEPQRANPNLANPNLGYPTLVSTDVKKELKERKPAMSGQPDGSEQTFDQFWQPYPNKVAKAAALKAWKKIKPDASLLARILSALATAKESDSWKKDGGRFVPHPATWLNGKRWEDESPAQAGKEEVLDRNAKAPPSWFKLPPGARWVQGLGVAW